MNKARILLCGMLLASTMSAMAQGAKNIRLNEVLTNNTTSIVDEFGNRWRTHHSPPITSEACISRQTVLSSTPK